MAIANALYNFMYINLETDVCLDQAFLLFCFLSLLSFFQFVYQNSDFLYSFVCPESHSVHKTILELRDLYSSASQVLQLKACASRPG